MNPSDYHGFIDDDYFFAYWDDYLMPYLDNLTDEEVIYYMAGKGRGDADHVLMSLSESPRVGKPPRDQNHAATYGVYRAGKWHSFEKAIEKYMENRTQGIKEAQIGEEAAIAEEVTEYEAEAPQPEGGGIPFINEAVERVRGAYETVKRAVMSPIERYRRRFRK